MPVGEVPTLPAHPMLNDPRRAEAYMKLRHAQRGSMRMWASQLGWSRTATNNFITQMRREGLVELRVGNGSYGSVLIFTEDAPGTLPGHGRVTIPGHSRNGIGPLPERLENKYERDLDSRNGSSTEPASEIGRVIGEMNTILSKKFNDYRPVSADQISSNDAFRRLGSEGIPLEFILSRLRYDAMAFNPEKAGRGEPPYSFKFFERRIRSAWERTVGESQAQAPAAPPREPPAVPPREPLAPEAPTPRRGEPQVRGSSPPTRLEAIIKRVTSRGEAETP